MKKQYVQVTLDAYLNESKSITLKRGYGERKPVVVGAQAPLRNQILAFVSESQKVSKFELKRFIAGLNETSKNPVAAANMWIKRNAKFFIIENKSGVTYFKLSKIGKRLTSHLKPISISEQGPQPKPGSYDFIDRKKGYARPGIYDEEDEESELDEEIDEIDEAQKVRIKKIIENIKAKRNKKLNEGDEDEDEDETKDDVDKKDKDEDDELTFDDLDLDSDEDKDKDEDKDEDKEDGEEKEDKEVGDEDKEDGEDKVEITEFIITVDNVDEAIDELSELEVTAEKVLDEEGEEIEDQVKVSADDWEALRGWLEEKGVDIEEMFGGEIEVEDEDEIKPEENLEDVEDLEDLGDLEGDKDLEGPDSEEFSLELDDDELDLEPEKDVEESVAGIEREEIEKPPIQGKEVTITIK